MAPRKKQYACKCVTAVLMAVCAIFGIGNLLVDSTLLCSGKESKGQGTPSLNVNQQQQQREAGNREIRSEKALHTAALTAAFFRLPQKVDEEIMRIATLGTGGYHRVTNGAPTTGSLREQFSELQLQLQQQQQLMIE